VMVWKRDTNWKHVKDKRTNGTIRETYISS
jgi:hypothetical protein